MKAYEQGTMMMLREVVARIGCAAAMPAEHKNEWMQDKFSLRPAGRIRIPGDKKNHLVWREADVEKARKLWEERRSQDSGVRIQHVDLGTGTKKLDPQAELAAMNRESDGWMKPNPKTPEEAGLAMLGLALDLIRQASGMLDTARRVPA
jgi:hypothetical protein